MDLMLVLKAMAALGAMGVGVGLLLATAAKTFHVEVDPKVEEIFSVLPGANCGACGNASCFAVAEAIAEGRAETNACTAGGPSVAEKVAEILGVEGLTCDAAISFRHCGGGKAVKRVYEYSGVSSCRTAARLAGGPIACPGGCIGFGDCVAVCPFDAMTMDERGLPVIDPAKCTGCGICVAECPRGHIGLLKTEVACAAVVVRCNSHDKAKDKRGYCPVSCIACKKCERECAYGAIVVEDNLAVIDYEKCTGCGVCVSVCPQNCIDLAPGPRGVRPEVTEGKAAEVPGFEPVRASASETGEETDAL